MKSKKKIYLLPNQHTILTRRDYNVPLEKALLAVKPIDKALNNEHLTTRVRDIGKDAGYVNSLTLHKMINEYMMKVLN